MRSPCVYLIFALSFTACSRPELPFATQSISGYFYNNCSNTPIPYKTITLFQDTIVDSMQYLGGVLGEGLTNNTGYFEIEFDRYGAGPISIISDGDTLINSIPFEIDTFTFHIYKNVTYNVLFELVIANVNIEPDSLTIDIFDDGTIDTIIYAPFSEGICYVASEIILPESNYTFSEDVPFGGALNVRYSYLDKSFVRNFNLFCCIFNSASIVIY